MTIDYKYFYCAGSVKNCSHCIYGDCDDMEQCTYGCMDTNYYGMSCDMPCNDECIPDYWSKVKCDGKSGKIESLSRQFEVS